jgi:hypothetical protein
MLAADRGRPEAGNPLTIDDPDTFIQPWQALRQYDRANRTLSENICSESNFNPFGIDYGTPVAEKPDF